MALFFIGLAVYEAVQNKDELAALLCILSVLIVGVNELRRIRNLL